MARSTDCTCDASFTCGHCCRNAKPWLFTPSDSSYLFSRGIDADNKMKSIKVTYADGNVVYTGINGTEEEIKAYYLNAEGFELDERKPLVKAVKVEFIGA